MHLSTIWRVVRLDIAIRKARLLSTSVFSSYLGVYLSSSDAVEHNEADEAFQARRSERGQFNERLAVAINISLLSRPEEGRCPSPNRKFIWLDRASGNLGDSFRLGRRSVVGIEIINAQGGHLACSIRDGAWFWLALSQLTCRLTSGLQEIAARRSMRSVS